MSTIFMIIAVLMWSRSLFLIDNWAWGTDAAEYQIFSSNGGIYFTRIVGWWNPHSFLYRHEGTKGWDAWGDESCYVLLKARPYWFGIVNGSLRDDGRQPCWVIVVPYWSLVVGSVFLPVLWLVRFIRYHRELAKGGFPITGLENSERGR
jgi:hypothetical protein